MTPDLQKGTELADRYTLLRRLGAGADTQTWLATDRMTRASVALKILSSDRLSAEFLRKEWQTSIRLMHAHIVRVFEFHDDSNCTFYSLQFVDGADASVLSGAPLAHVLSPMILIANALQYSHGKGVVHRDIKTSNILLDSNGAPYLSDFGVAALATSEAAGGSLIAASPQSVNGEIALPSDDVFAFGGLIYELVAGQSPYSSENTSDDILHKIPASLTAASGEAVPNDVVDLVASMLDKDAAARPDAAAVAARLLAAGYTGAPAPVSYVGAGKSSSAEIIEASDGLQAHKASPAAKPMPAMTDKSGINPRTVGISLIVLVVLLVAVVFILPNTVSTDNEATTPEDAPIATTDTDSEAAVEEEPQLPDRDGRVVARSETEAVLGQLLSMMSTLEGRAVQRWGGVRYRQALDLYAEGDAAYLARDYATASDKYLATIEIVEPLLEEVDQVFASTFSEAQAALDAANTQDALRLFELAVAISPNHAAAQAGYARAKNLDNVLALTERGATFEKDLELAAAQQSFQQAVELDPQWEPAQAGLQRVKAEINQMEFDARMTEGLFAIADGHYDAARAAFRMAKALQPSSREPADGLLQVEQEVRLNQISAYEQQAQQQEDAEAWLLATATYERLLEIDDSMDFAQQGLQRARQMSALHKQLDEFILKPDSLSAPSTMQKAATMVVDITRMPEVGPRLSAQRDELSRLLKRAATPLRVQLISDNATDVSIYKVGKLGSFETHELTLRPGTYVAVGSRPGFRDVRLEFLVGPEQEARPIVIRCEEAI